MVNLNKESVKYILLAETHITEDGHYLYLGCKNQAGYGVKMINNTNYGVHRLGAYIFHNLDLNNKDILALHKNSCIYKNCWSENCIYTGSHTDNMRDIRNLSKFRCGHIKNETRIWIPSEKRWKCKVCIYIKGRENKRKHQIGRGEIKDRKQKLSRIRLKWKRSRTISTTISTFINPFAKTEGKENNASNPHT